MHVKIICFMNLLPDLVVAQCIFFSCVKQKHDSFVPLLISSAINCWGRGEGSIVIQIGKLFYYLVQALDDDSVTITVYYESLCPNSQ